MSLIFFKKHNNEKGTSVIELVVASAIFAVVVTAALGIFINAMKAQKMITAKKNVAENMRYAMEYMVKELRMAESIDGGYKNGATPIFVFNNSASHEITYSLVGTAIEKKDVTDATGFQPISSDEVSITGLSFIINNWGASIAPLITIVIRAEALSGIGGEMELQTSVSPRMY